MKNVLVLGGLLLVSVSMAGCASFDAMVADINSPATQQAVATLGKVATAVICDLSQASATAQTIETGIGASSKVTGTTNDVYVSSSIVCSQLSGVAVGTATNVNAVTAVSVPVTAAAPAAQ